MSLLSEMHYGGVGAGAGTRLPWRSKHICGRTVYYLYVPPADRDLSSRLHHSGENTRNNFGYTESLHYILLHWIHTMSDL